MAWVEIFVVRCAVRARLRERRLERGRGGVLGTQLHERIAAHALQRRGEPSPAGEIVHESIGRLERSRRAAGVGVRLGQHGLHPDDVLARAQLAEASPRVAEQLEALLVAAVADGRASEHDADEAHTPLIATPAEGLPRATQPDLGLLDPALIGAHLADVALADRRVGEIAGAGARLAGLRYRVTASSQRPSKYVATPRFVSTAPSRSRSPSSR